MRVETTDKDVDFDVDIAMTRPMRRNSPLGEARSQPEGSSIAFRPPPNLFEALAGEFKRRSSCAC